MPSDCEACGAEITELTGGATVAKSSMGSGSGSIVATVCDDCDARIDDVLEGPDDA